MHCLSRTPSTKKSQLGSNYSALTLKFGGPESARISSLNRNHFMLPQHNASEIIQIKDVRKSNEPRNFACRVDDGPPFLMDHSYQSVVQFAPSYDPANFSCSQQTTVTTVSRDPSIKKSKKVRLNLNIKANVAQPNGIRRNSFTEKLKDLIFKSDVNLPIPIPAEQNLKIAKKLSNESIKSENTISNSSLKEVDEDEFTSSEMAQMMSEVNNEIRNVPAKTS